MRDQFGLARVTVKKPTLLCVPSKKTLVEMTQCKLDE
jgi:hypothetical protein